MNTQMPIGVDDFKEVRENYYFVDKTHFIQSLIDGHSKVTLLTRPCRFGKTLTMSMLDYFFSLERESESLHLFDGLQIARAGIDYMKHRGQYPVLFMTFKGIQNDTWDLAFNAFQLVIQKEFQQHRYLLDSPELAPEEKQLYSRFLDNTATLAEYQVSLLYLCEYLYRYYKIRPIILIDEYDAPIQNAYNHGFYDTAISYFRTFYNNTLKGNEFLNFAILTGVLRIAKESIFSGLNNLRVCSILDNAYDDVMGFTEEEVTQIAKDTNEEQALPALKKWYDGYRFGNIDIYNPWSIINFFAERTADDYWVNTSSNDIIQHMMQGNAKSQEKNLLTLLHGGTVAAIIREGLIYKDITQNKDGLYTLLLMTGYLTAVQNTTVPNGRLCQLRIPNKELTHVFQSEILNRLCAESGDVSDLYMMMNHLLSGQVTAFSEELQTYIEQLVSVYDAANKESFYHGLVLGMTALVLNDYYVESNRESGYGRFDIAIFPRRSDLPGVILEFKVAPTENDLKEKAREALQQIEKQQYIAEFKQKQIPSVLKYGISFCGKKTYVTM